MSLQKFFVIHGEKLLIAGIFAGGALAVYFAYTADQPKNATDKVNQVVSDLENATKSEPRIKAPTDYAEICRKRLGQPLQTQALIPFLSRHPSYEAELKTDIPRKPHIAEMTVPRLGFEARTLQVELTAFWPTWTRTDAETDAHVTDAPKPLTWTRKPRQVINNSFRWMGLFIEVRKGSSEEESAWTPLNAPGIDNGFLPFSPNALNEAKNRIIPPVGPIKIANLEEWTRYTFRARLLAAATGHDPEAKEMELGKEVIVYKGRQKIGGMNEGSESEILNAVKNNKLTSLTGQPPLASKYQGYVPGLQPREICYSGPVSEIVGGIIQPSVSIAFLGTTSKMANGASVEAARLAITKQVTDPQGNNPQWLKERRPADPIKFEVALGDVVGGKRVLPNPHRNGELDSFDLTTPFVLKAVLENGERVRCYRVVIKREGKKADLDVQERLQANYASVVLNNKKTGDDLVLPKLTLALPVEIESDTVKISPLYPVPAGQTSFNEQEYWLNTPLAKHPPLRPNAPIKRDPVKDNAWFRAAALKANHSLPNDPVTANIIEMPDGRILYLDPNNPSKINVIGGEARIQPAGQNPAVTPRAATGAAIKSKDH